MSTKKTSKKASKKVSKGKSKFATTGRKTLGTDAKIISRYVRDGGISLRAMAIASGVSHTTVIQWTQDKCAPSDVTLKRLNKDKNMRGLVGELVAARVAAIGVPLSELRNGKAKAEKASPRKTAGAKKAGKPTHAKRSAHRASPPAGAKKTEGATSAETLSTSGS